jgi:uracil-DNA glycosylase family 4
MGEPADLIYLYDLVRGSKHFRHLHEGGRLVPGTGPEDAKVMVIGDAPGATEVDTGQPFTGRSGLILNQLLNMAGLNRSDCFLTYLLKYRTPGNRPVSAAEAIRAAKFLRKEWLAVRPVLTIAAGATTAAAISAEDGVHGGIFPYWLDEETGRQHWVTIVYAPGFGRKNQKARAWIEKEWKMLGEHVREELLEVLCPECHGNAPRGKCNCFCNGTLAF